MQVIFTPAARAELVDAEYWYETKQQGLGMRFREEQPWHVILADEVKMRIYRWFMFAGLTFMSAIIVFKLVLVFTHRIHYLHDLRMIIFTATGIACAIAALANGRQSSRPLAPDVVVYNKSTNRIASRWAQLIFGAYCAVYLLSLGS